MIRNFGAIFALTLLFAYNLAFGQSLPAPAVSGSSIQAPPTQTTPAPSFVDAIKKTIVFIEADCNEMGMNGTPTLKSYSGTAFLLSVPDDRLKDRSFTYLVTNRHVAQPGIEDGKPCTVVRYFLRADLKRPKPDGSYTDLSLLRPDQIKWTFPSDPSVDLAIAPISVDVGTLDVEFLPSTFLMSDSNLSAQHVEEGDSVMFSGLFVQLIGQTHSEPIVRQGKIAMIPKEPVPTTLRKLGEIFLVDCHVFGGNSGSPLFINLGGQREMGFFVGLNYKLLGVVSGYMKESADFSLQTVASYAGTMDANSGIATVVPAQKLIDLINDPSLKALRENAVSQFGKKRP